MTKKQKDNLKLLKFVVHLMGIVLIGGTILLFILVIYRYQGKSEQDAVKKSECIGNEITLEAGEKLHNATYNDKSITLVINAQNDGISKQIVRVIDLCSREVLGELTINHKNVRDFN